MLYLSLFEVGGDHRLLFEALEKLLIPYHTHLFPEVAKTIYLNWREEGRNGILIFRFSSSSQRVGFGKVWNSSNFPNSTKGEILENPDSQTFKFLTKGGIWGSSGFLEGFQCSTKGKFWIFQTFRGTPPHPKIRQILLKPRNALRDFKHNVKE